MVFDIKDLPNRRIVTDFPYQIEKHPHLWINLADGRRLAASLWLPVDAKDSPVPAILEYIPYRKNDFTAIRDSARHPYFAGQGYACLRVDIAGSGDSSGYLEDEYLKKEQDDALEVLDWLQAQSWCTGKVGMIGKSWGGFSGLQVAARQHPALKAVISLCSTDDRYNDDVHYKGGSVMSSDMLWWASTMLAYNARPQDPQVVGKSWRDNWLGRLEKTPPFVEAWLTHQKRDHYWKHGSICENYEQVDVPVLAVSGWQDGYTNAVFRLVENLPQARGIIGPWAHEYPEVARPEPAIGFLQEALDFWDLHLKGKKIAAKDRPKLISWMQDSLPPAVNYDKRPGRWVLDDAWPSKNVQSKSYWLGQSALTTSPQNQAELRVESREEHGFYAGVFCPFGQAGDLASDQRLEEGRSLTLRTPPLSEDIEVLGRPHLRLSLSADQENALVTARLSDKAPDGAATLISWGLLNLNRSPDQSQGQKLEPGKIYEVSFFLDALGQKIPQGHQLELALSPGYWPQIWPSPKPVTLTVYGGEKSRLDLPLRRPQPSDGTFSFPPPETAPILKRRTLRPDKRTRKLTHDLVTDCWTLEDFSDEGLREIIENGLIHGSQNTNTYSIRSGDPLSAQVDCKWELVLERKDWQIKIKTHSIMTSDLKNFHLVNHLWAFEKGKEIFKKTWEKTIPRQDN